jgi:hypothetical protein
MQAGVILEEDGDASDAATRFLLLFGYWVQCGQFLPEAAGSDVAVSDRQPGYVTVSAPVGVVLATMLRPGSALHNPAERRGDINIPNSALLSAAVGPVPPPGDTRPATTTADHDRQDDLASAADGTLELPRVR